MPIVFKANQDPYGLSALGQLAGTFLGQRQKQNRQQKAQTILSEALNRASEPAVEGQEENQLSGIQRVLEAAKQQGISPEDVQAFLGMTPGQAYMMDQNNQAAQQAAYQKALLQQQKLQNEANKNPAQQAFEVEQAKDLSKQVSNLREAAANENQFNRNIAELRELSPKTGVGGSYSLWKGGAGSEFDSKALMLAEPAIQMLTNGRGAVSKEKVELIKARIIPSSHERSSVIEGKLKAAESLNKKLAPTYQRIRQLYKEFPNSEPPIALLREAIDGGNAVIDEFLEEGKSTQDKSPSESLKIGDKIESAEDVPVGAIVEDDKGRKLQRTATGWKQV